MSRTQAAKAFPVTRTEQEWRERLSPEEFHVTREKGTEQAFTGRYHDSKQEGTYHCVGCDRPLFASDAKYESGTGWPSFWAAIDPGAVDTEEDRSLFMSRTEVLCAECGAHLGHLFPDGPQPTGDRYCMNSLALRLDEEGQPDEEG